MKNWMRVLAAVTQWFAVGLLVGLLKLSFGWAFLLGAINGFFVWVIWLSDWDYSVYEKGDRRG